MDFARIRSDHDGQRASFEQLVCQLARRDTQAVGSKFRRVDGAGGDGGVEAYWLLPDGSEVGYQAKYFLATSQVDWTQIDKSVEAAIANHPKLKNYIVAVPCDFTDRTGGKGGGSTGWDRWATRVVKWSELVRAKGANIEFEAWTRSELIDRLLHENARGLRQYWFGDIDLSQKWFRRQFDLAAANLDDRYHPEDHVDLDVSRLFLTLVRDNSVVHEARALLKAIKGKSGFDLRLAPKGPKPDETLLADAISATSDLQDLGNQLRPAVSEPWNFERWQDRTSAALTKVRELYDWTWVAEKEGSKDELRSYRHDLRELIDTIEGLDRFLNRKALTAERVRCALVEGGAGSGKSHLLASEASRAIDMGAPAILFLGQQLGVGPLWPQLMYRLGLGTRDPGDVLAALDAAAEARGTRALILVDALNEGAGAQLWAHELPGFLRQLGAFPHIACVVSCRTEYLDAVIPHGLREVLPTFRVQGFESPVEQERAARIYLDRRGIARPATPWLSPEFVNPLFLRTCAVALERDGLHEFPKGLHGTKRILAFYLASLGRLIDRDAGNSGAVPGRLIRAIKALATEMAQTREDFVPEDRAEQIVAEAFLGLDAPGRVGWLVALLRHSLLRKDPDPTERASDPLLIPPEVIRFSFQRFQDALVAEALLEQVTDLDHAFSLGQPLHFLVADRRHFWGSEGLVEALSTQLPERFGKEFVDLLPGGIEHWWHDHHVVDAFAESLRWRDPKAFTERTRELLNALEGTHVSVVGILLEVSLSIDHPYNAAWLHRVLMGRALAARDALWSQPLALEVGEGHPAFRLVDWALFAPKEKAAPETIALCATVLTWFFALSHRPLRDRATKALTALFIANSDLFDRLVDQFAGVDDPYVLERLYAAGYGAACLDPNPNRLASYAALAYRKVFAGTPPLNLLVRDHARGLIQLAQQTGCLPSEVDVNRATPPYKSDPPVFDATDEIIEQMAADIGDTHIKSSCSEHYDFARYEIWSAVDGFFDVRLSALKPKTAQGRFESFRREVVETSSSREAAFEALQRAKIDGVVIRIAIGADEPTPKLPSKAETDAWRKIVKRAETSFLKLLTTAEKERYAKDVVPYWAPRDSQEPDPPLLKAKSAYLWVTRRAYQFGWTKDLFPNDGGHHWRDGRDRPKVERIGKKYQWMALDELLCRLADNHWMTSDMGSGARVYGYPGDIGFIRDVDPTVLPKEANEAAEPTALPAWALGPTLNVRVCRDEELSAWPFEADPGKSVKDLLIRRDEKGVDWLTLYDLTSVDLKAEKRSSFGFDIRQQEFRILMSALVPAERRKSLPDHLVERRSIDRHDWDPIDVFDGPYLMEAGWRANWDSDPWRKLWKAPGDARYAKPLVDYLWESHLDCSLPDGARTYLPSPWLIRELGLAPAPNKIGTFLSAAGVPTFISTQSKGLHIALIRAKPFEAFLAKNDLSMIWTFIAERTTWTNANLDLRASRRSEAVAWRTARGLNSRSWNQDDHLRDD